MARSLDQISKDLTKLQAETVSINDDLKSLYEEYLTVLGKAIKQQLVLAVYHLCTQAYPAKFLQLSVSQREKVQAKIRKIATQGQAQVEQLSKVINSSGLEIQLSQALTSENDPAAESDSSLISDSQLENDSDTTTEGEAVASEAIASEAVDGETAVESQEHDTEETATSTPKVNIGASTSKETSEMIQRLSASLSLFTVFGAEPLSPVSLAKRHVLLERHLRATLQALSSMANHLLKTVQILPDLPEMVIAAAAEAEAGESGGSNTPNVLNVLVEIGGDIRTKDNDEDEPLEEEEEDSDFEENTETEREMTHLVAINLRLADIEFADALTAMWRSRLQETLIRLKRLGSRFQKLQQEKARADAEHAWRATWFEE